MKIGIPVIDENGMDSTLSEHFGRTAFYVFADVEDNKIEKIELVRNPFEQHGPGQIPNWVAENGVDTMIVKGIGTRAITFFTNLGIKVVKATGDTAKDCLEDYLSGKTDDTDPACNHNHSQGHEHQGHEASEKSETCKKKYGTVALTVKDKSLDAQTDERFARGKYIVIINGENGTVEFLENNPVEEHGVGPKMIGTLANKGVKTIIAKSLGQNATLAAQEAGITAYEAEDGSGNENLEKLWSGKLKAL